MSYTVKVTREGSQWLADVVDVQGAHTYAGNLESLARNVDEVLRLVDDTIGDSDVIELDWDFTTADVLVREAAVIGKDRETLIRETRQNEVATVLVLNKLLERGYSTRDVAQLLKMSAGRVSQIKSTSAA